MRRVLGSCDGNLLAVTVLGRALKQREQLCGWQQVCDDFMAKLSDPNDEQWYTTQLQTKGDGGWGNHSSRQHVE